MSRIIMPTALAVSVFAVSHAYAATSTASQPEQTLPVIVLTASKTPEALDKVPARISVIDQQTIEQSPVTDLPHLLQSEAALNVVQLGGYGQQTSIFTRGTNSSHTLVLDNGVRLNTGSQSAANTQFIDTSLISRIEVLKGPASVQYGSDPIGGVIQLISLAPKQQRLFTTIEAGEQNTYKNIVGADLVHDDLYVQVRGQRQETDGSPIVDKPASKDAAYDQKGYLVKAGIDNSEYAASAELKENKGNNQYLNFGALTSQDFFNRVINLKGRYHLSEQLKINLRWSKFEDQITQKKPNYLNQIDFANTDSQETDANLQWYITPTQNILFGATTRQTDVDSLSYGTKYDKALDSTGYYLQHQYQSDIISVQSGVRFEDNKQFGSHTVGQFGIRYFVAPKTSIYTNIGSAFKAPTGDDLYGYGGNPKLNPETSVSYEIGLDHQVNQYLSTYFSSYRTRVKDLINTICIDKCETADPYDDVYQNNNVSKAALTGAEAGFKFKYDSWYVNTEFAYIQPKNVDTKEDLLRRPRQTVTLGAGWNNGTFGLNGALVAKSHAKDSGLTNTPGHLTGNINVFWQVNPYVRVFTNVENIGDTTYKTAYAGSGVYYISAPRLATAGITLSY